MHDVPQALPAGHERSHAHPAEHAQNGSGASPQGASQHPAIPQVPQSFVQPPPTPARPAPLEALASAQEPPALEALVIPPAPPPEAEVVVPPEPPAPPVPPAPPAPLAATELVGARVPRSSSAQLEARDSPARLPASAARAKGRERGMVVTARKNRAKKHTPSIGTRRTKGRWAYVQLREASWLMRALATDAS